MVLCISAGQAVLRRLAWRLPPLATAGYRTSMVPVMPFSSWSATVQTNS